MANSNLLLIFLTGIIALALALFQYYFKPKKNYKTPALFTFLRFLSIFSLLLLLLNPKIYTSESYLVKPNLVLAVDNSSSVKNFGAAQKVIDFVQEITNNEALAEHFNIQVYSFGNELKHSTDFTFSEPQTKIGPALNSLCQLYENSVSPTILITDGNQTYGRDFNVEASEFENTIFPVLVGDTTKYRDISISRVNSNKYSFLNNRFPVEIFVSYSGEGKTGTTLSIVSGETTVFSEGITLSETNNSEIIRTTLPASSVGTRVYKVEVIPLENEKNTINNVKTFSVEVIDERTSVLLISAISHPDLGAIKRAIETNKRRKVEIAKVQNEIPNLKDYQWVILYQPNQKFKSVLEKLKQEKIPYWVITGPETDWNFLNNIQENFTKEITGQTEEFFPVYNENFTAFQFEDPGFSDFPPLIGRFGETVVQIPVEPILFKQIQGQNTKRPLLFTFGEPNFKKTILFGAGIWKWRARSFVEEGSFAKFDNFIGDLVQYSASNLKRERLMIAYDPFYYVNEKIVISADYFDENYEFDPRGELILEINNLKTQKTSLFPFILKNNTYQVELNNLVPGNYSFSVSVEGEDLQKSGKFSIDEFSIEQQFNSSNLPGLQEISESFNVPVYFLNGSEKLIQDILSNNTYRPVQKTRKNHVSLIDWYYLLAIIALSLSAEWFLRKYYGLI
ncbi:MAG TPA: VWA domain-containing protein [Salinimicrobium sp.]|nr:VWA domain-containing protein [Salinimicrobium sp.]